MGISICKMLGAPFKSRIPPFPELNLPNFLAENSKPGERVTAVLDLTFKHSCSLLIRNESLQLPLLIEQFLKQYQWSL
jgi:hypothetical protein